MKQKNNLIYLCFFLSGAAGLIYEVVWARQLGLFLGITSYAHTAVITAYMLGLAVGSWWIGSWSDRLTQPLRFYAWLEIGIGLYAAGTPWLLDSLQAGYAGWAGMTGVVGSGAHLTRFAIALAALLLPTFLMGGTLPLLVRGVTARLPQLGSITGRLYGINTLGATAGTVLAGFVLLPHIGMFNTVMTGVVINLGIALLILLFVPSLTTSAAAGIDTVTANAPGEEYQVLKATQRFVLLGGFAAAGFAALLTQLAWIRSMILVVGGSVYAFTITLSSFLAGVGLGSLVYSHWLSHRYNAADRFLMAALLAFLIGLTILLGLPLIAQLPAWFLWGFQAGWVENFKLYQVFMFALCFAVMFVPTLLMGALFPLLAVTWTGSMRRAGQGIGSAYAVNTVGTVLGALLGGLVLLPWLGIHYSIMLAATTYIAVAFGFWLGAEKRRPMALAAAVMVFTLAAWLVPPWDRALMAAGVYYRPEFYLEGMHSKSLDDFVHELELLYYREGRDSTVSVLANSEQRSLLINGKIDASSKSDLETQVGLGQLGALLHPDPRHALLIGLGSGITAAALATHRSIEDITVLEISPEVVEASTFFAKENRQVLNDPRLTVVSADARNFVLATRRQWDLIISEPSNPWISGVSNLFTQDFFRLAKQKLAPGGIMTQWFNIRRLSVEDVKSIIRSFADSYRHVSVWHMQRGDLVMTGSDQVHTLDFRRLRAALADSRIEPDLARAGFTSPIALLRHFLAADDDLESYTAGNVLNTDNHPRIEFNAPRLMYAGQAGSNMTDFTQFFAGKKFQLPLVNQFTMSASGLHVLSMDLHVTALEETGFEDVQTAWLVWRQAFDLDGKRAIAVADQRELTWNENGAGIRLKVLHSNAQPVAEEQIQSLTQILTLPVLEYGNMNHASDPDVWWTVGTVPGQDWIEVGLAWTCPLADGTVNRFLVLARHPDPGPNKRRDFVISFGARFQCTG